MPNRGTGAVEQAPDWQRMSALIRRMQNIAVWMLVIQIGLLTAAAPALHGLFGCSHQHSRTHQHADHQHSHSHVCGHTHDCQNELSSTDDEDGRSGISGTEFHGNHDCLICRHLQSPVSFSDDAMLAVSAAEVDEAFSSSLASPFREQHSERARGPPRLL